MKLQVYKIHSDFYYIKDDTNLTYECKLKDVLKKQKIDVCVGDFVELSEDKKFIIKRLKRLNSLNKPHVANIDLALIVCALKEPNLDLIQLNRYLTYLKYYNIDCAICFNKEDLDKDLTSTKEKINEIYERLGYKLFFISAKNGTDLAELKVYIKNKSITLCGLSGVGKTTLLNSLNQNISLKTGVVSKKLQRGCHTTRHCEIIEFEDFKIIDTPGFSCLKFNFLLPNDLINLFDDIKQYTLYCKYSNCLHNNIENKNCAVIQNLDNISPSRYESFLLFLDEALEYKEEISKKSTKNEGFNKVVGNKTMTKISKRKRSYSRKKDNQSLKGESDE